MHEGPQLRSLSPRLCAGGGIRLASAGLCCCQGLSHLSLYRLPTSTSYGGPLRCCGFCRCACSARIGCTPGRARITCHDDTALPQPIPGLVLQATCRASNPMSHPCAAFSSPHTACSGSAPYALLVLGFCCSPSLVSALCLLCSETGLHLQRRAPNMIACVGTCWHAHQQL